MKNAAAGANDRDGIITTIEDQQDQQQREQLQLQLQLQLQQNQNHNLRIFDVTVGIRSKKTAAVYQSVFKRFLKHIKINDLQVLLDYSRTRPQIIKEMLVGYVLYLRDEKPGRKLTRGSIKLHLAAILHFFQINNDEFTLTMRNFRIHLPPDEFIDNDDRAYTHQEIFQILKACDVRSRVLVLLLCSSGMRVGAARTLQIGDLTEMTLDGVNLLYRIQVYARTRDRYYTFCTPECYKAIQEYMEYRVASGESITNNSKAPLIREQFNTDDPFRLNVPKTLSDDAIRYIIRNVV
ncbi:MAG TPA: hypothetical protein VH500_25085, partial [Nitrososphaeraceae archaeon]